MRRVMSVPRILLLEAPDRRRLTQGIGGCRRRCVLAGAHLNHPHPLWGAFLGGCQEHGFRRRVFVGVWTLSKDTSPKRLDVDGGERNKQAMISVRTTTG